MYFSGQPVTLQCTWYVKVSTLNIYNLSTMSIHGLHGKLYTLQVYYDYHWMGNEYIHMNKMNVGICCMQYRISY